MTRRAHLRLLLIYTIAWEPVRVFCNGLLNAALRAAIGRKMAGFRMSHAGHPPFSPLGAKSLTLGKRNRGCRPKAAITRPRLFGSGSAGL